MSMLRIGCLLLSLLFALPAAAADLTIERIFSDPSLAGPTPRAVKISPDGRRVALLRGRAADQHQLDLWLYDVKDATLQLRVDSVQLAPAEHLSDAEKARRERERTQRVGADTDHRQPARQRGRRRRSRR